MALWRAKDKPPVELVVANLELRLWSDFYLIQGRYIVIMGAPSKTSSLFVLNGLDVYPSLYGSSPLMSNRISYFA